MARPKKDPAIKQMTFIEAAQSLFFEKGYEKVSIQDILKKVGNGKALSPSVFYYYFESKEDIFQKSVNIYMANHSEKLIKLLECKELSYKEKMVQALTLYAKAIEDFKQIDTYFDSPSTSSKYFNYLIDEYGMSSLVEPITKLIDEGINEGMIKGNDLMEAVGTKMTVQIFLSSILPLTHQGKEQDGKHHAEKYVNVVPLLFNKLLGVEIM